MPIASTTLTHDVSVTNDSDIMTRNVADTIVGGDVIVLANESYLAKSVDGTSITLNIKYKGATDTDLSGVIRHSFVAS